MADLVKDIEAQGGKILDPPKEYDYVPGYYAVFFSDPDGIRLEITNYRQERRKRFEKWNDAE